MLPLRLRLLLLAVALLALVACNLPNGERWRWDRDQRDKRDRDDRGGEGDTSNTPLPEASVGAKKAAESVNAFAADLYGQLRGEDTNLIVSPYSVAVALAMTRAGTEGKTAAELDAVLHLPVKEKINDRQAFREMTESVTTAPRGAKQKPELAVANSLWLQQGYPWKKEFLAVGREDFHAGLFDVNFRSNPEGARGSINHWVEKETHNRIKDIVPPSALSTQTRIVLANAIYFKARWAEAFKKEDTTPEDFTLADGKKVRAPLMFHQSTYRLWETDNLQVLKLPYDGRATSMYVLLPQAADGLPVLERQLDAARLAEWTTIMNATSAVRVWLPRFKFTVPTELVEALQKLGVKDAFEPGRANFKSMTDSPEGLYINRVIHKAFVETDEAGTEAAAATAVTMALGSVAQPAPAPPPRNFRADHPFLFVIKHEPTGAVLFLGRVLDPTR
jgi:serpin B